MIFVGILAPITMSPWESGAQVALLQNSAGHRLHCSKIPRVALWRLHNSAGALWRLYNSAGQTYIVLVFKGYICKPLSFQRYIHSLGLVLKEKIFCVTVPLTGIFYSWPFTFYFILISGFSLLFTINILCTEYWKNVYGSLINVYCLLFFLFLFLFFLLFTGHPMQTLNFSNTHLPSHNFILQYLMNQWWKFNQQQPL